MTNSADDTKTNPSPKHGTSEKQRAGTTPPAAAPKEKPADEIGGPKGPEPTRFGDWEQKGRCSDF